MTPKSKEMMVDYSSNYDIEVNAKTGKEERKISRPVTSDQYNEITQKMFSEMKSSPQTNNVNYNFLCEMIPHHMGAVRMGENAMKYSICQELRPIISAIIRSQKEGIAKMQVLVRHYQST